MRIRTLTLCAFLVLLTACVPWQTAYYKPSGPDERFKRDRGGPDDNLTIELSDGLWMRISTYWMSPWAMTYHRTKNKEIEIKMFMTESHKLKLQSQSFEFIDDISGKSESYSVNWFSYYNYRSDGLKKEKISANQELSAPLLPSEYRCKSRS